MRIAIAIVTLFALLAAAGLSNSEADKEPTLYTAYNIWRASNMKCINFKEGSDIIPAGTEIRDVKINEQEPFPPYLVFTTVQDGRTYKIGFTQRWHPKKSIKDYRQMMFTTQNFEALTEGLSDIEIDAIKKGVLVNGMSKRAVVVCYGPPPEHYTPDRNALTWYYWANRKDKIAIKFDEHHKTVIGASRTQKTEVFIPRVSLRKEPMEISSEMNINKMLAKYGFFDSSRNADGSFVNDFVDNNDSTVTDKATGLTWQRGGSSETLDNRGANSYIEQLNRQRFAGYSDWRMPTLEELASLLNKNSGGSVHTTSVFENKQSTCWTVDPCDGEYDYQLGAWIINFKQGQVQRASYLKPSFTMNFPVYQKNEMNYVKAVRSAN